MKIKRKQFLFLTILVLQVSFCKSQDLQLKELASQCPEIQDTTVFINKLIRELELEVDRTSEIKDRISTFKKIKIKGSEDEFIFLEYDHGDGAMVFFPFKYQIVFTLDGKPIKIFSAMRYEFLKVELEEPPYLLTVTSTSKGNGGHGLYRFMNGELISVYDGFKDYFPRTYDAHDDNLLNEPMELNLSIEDVNKDGKNDLRFHGFMVGVTKGKNPVEYIFLFDRESERFREKENYSEKYKHLEEF